MLKERERKSTLGVLRWRLDGRYGRYGSGDSEKATATAARDRERRETERDRHSEGDHFPCVCGYAHSAKFETAKWP